MLMNCQKNALGITRMSSTQCLFIRLFVWFYILAKFIQELGYSVKQFYYYFFFQIVVVNFKNQTDDFDGKK